MAAEEEKAATSRAFSTYGCTLDMILFFKYLVSVLLLAYDDWLGFIRNLPKARAVWRRMTRILSREGARPLVSRFLFKAAVQLVLLFGAETWVFTPPMGKVR